MCQDTLFAPPLQRNTGLCMTRSPQLLTPRMPPPMLTPVPVPIPEGMFGRSRRARRVAQQLRLGVALEQQVPKRSRSTLPLIASDFFYSSTIHFCSWPTRFFPLGGRYLDSPCVLLRCELFRKQNAEDFDRDHPVVMQSARAHSCILS